VGDRICDVGNGRWLARTIPGARYVELAGADHASWGDQSRQILAEIREFLTGTREPPNPDRVLATVLFTDIVSSTERAVDLGDRAWRELLQGHQERMRRLIRSFGGREVDTAGDGFLVTFEGPARAIRCALSAVQSEDAAGLQIRAGIHTGECEVLGSKLAGVGVHIGSRVASAAEPGEVLVSRTVRDLVAGSGIELHSRGSRVLKGVPGEWEVFAAAGSTHAT
jgi:class 3 adenylate cyclase